MPDLSNSRLCPLLLLFLKYVRNDGYYFVVFNMITIYYQGIMILGITNKKKKIRV